MEVTDAQQQSSQEESKASPALLDEICTSSIASLCACLMDMYEHIDDTLFDLADRAHNNNEQSLYFESMREIRTHRQAAEKVFQQSMENAFARMKTKESATSSQEELEAETLALVDNEDMEIDVAINNMVHRARCEFPAALLQLTMRLNTFMPVECHEDNLPLDPQQIVAAFTQSTQDIDLDIKVRIIFYKQFEKFVLLHLDEMLFDANEILINADVLPNIRAQARKTPDAAKPAGADKELEAIKAAEKEYNEAQRRKGPPNTQPVGDTPNQPASDAAFNVQFNTLQSLLTAAENLQAKSVYIQEDPNKPALAQKALFDWLSNIQTEQLEKSSDGSAPKPITVREQVFDFIEQAGAHDPNNRLQKVDDNVINIVDMIFEFILDQDIPAPMAALIGRLQIPILKVAIRDQEFFDSTKHPARRLLNEIAQASLGWNESSHYDNDPLYKKVEDIVRTILKTEHPDVELFTALEKEFHDYIASELKRSERLAERTASAEEGKAQLEANKKLIGQLIRDRIHGKQLPQVVIDLVNTPWQKVMLQIISKQGRDSDAWRSALATIDDLIWSVQMHSEDEARKRWMTLIPTLLDRLSEGLKTIAHSPAETEASLDALWEIHSKMLKHKGEDNPVETVKVDLTHVQSNATISPLVKRQVPPDTIRQLRQQISQFQEGSWFEFILVGERKISCRLIKKIRANDSFVFANRYGAKAKAITKDQLALYIHDEKARQLDSGPLIDRAMQAVMLRLKNSLP